MKQGNYWISLINETIVGLEGKQDITSSADLKLKEGNNSIYIAFWRGDTQTDYFSVSFE